MDFKAVEHHLLHDPVPKLLRQLAIPAAVGFFFNTMYNVVDTWVAGQLSAEALAALSLTFPVFFVIIALSTGIGTGVTAVISNQLGADQVEKAKRYATQALSYGLFISVIITIAGYTLAPTLFRILGASDSYLDSALTYMQPLFLGAVFFSMSSILNGILNAIGDTKAFRNVLIAGFFLNLLISPWLAFGWLGVPALGIFGIALATIITNALGAAYLLRRVWQSELLEAGSIRSRMKPELTPFKDITVQGLPASFSMMTVAVGAFIITYFVSQYGPDAVAGYGAALRVEQIVLIPGIGINIAVLTLIGQNNGAKLFDRVREVIRYGLLYSVMIGTVASLLIFTAAPYLMQIFTDNETVTEFGLGYLFIAALLTWAYGIVFVTDSALRGLKRPLFPLLLGIIRQVVLPIPVFYFIVTYSSLAITTLWWGIFAIVWSAAIIALLYMYYLLHKECTTH